MTAFKTRDWILKRRPQGMFDPSQDVEFQERTLSDPPEGMIIIRNAYISLDPAIRDWMSDTKSYLPPIPLDGPVWSSSVGEVVASNSSVYKVGDMVWGMGSWSDYSMSPDFYVFPVDASLGLPLQNFLSIVGAVGMTAYYGLLRIGQPKPGETVLVSAAAGAVGSVVGQIAKIKGCRVVGLAGSDEKCAWLTDELGFDASINYKTAGNLETAIANACPDGVDIYFENVGGEILDAALMNINKHARIPFCGRISVYNEKDKVPGPYNMWQLLAQTARMEGFLISDFFGDFAKDVPEMASWVKSGQIKFKEDIIEGLEHTPETFLKLFTGANTGKLMVKI